MKMIYFIVSSLILSALAALPEQAVATDIRINCDMRILQLNDEQQNQIRLRRQQYKAEQNHIHQNQNAPNPATLRHLLTKLNFDNQQANQIAKQHYANDVRLTVAELNFYHDIFQLLNEEQQAIWLQRCIPTQAN